MLTTEVIDQPIAFYKSVSLRSLRTACEPSALFGRQISICDELSLHESLATLDTSAATVFVA